MITVVLDASVLLAIILPDERSDEGGALVEAAAAGELTVVVPPMASAEVCNGVAVALARRRLTRTEAMDALGLFDDLSIDVVAPRLSLSELLELALAETISVYDATYLALAMQQRGRLSTLDAALGRAARRRGVLYATGS